MKLIRSEDDKLLFHCGRREKDLLIQLLKVYPRTPPAHQKLSKSGKIDPSTEQLLNEALAEQRTQNQRQIATFLAGSGRWAPHQSGWQLSLALTEAEWLLQVLNDIRVGSWVMLGCPEQRFEQFDEHTAVHFWYMEMAGAFEVALLEALQGRG